MSCQKKNKKTNYIIKVEKEERADETQEKAEGYANLPDL